MVSATPPMLTVALLAWLLPSSGHPASGLTFAPEHPRETLRVWFLRVLEAGAGFFLWGSSPHSGCGTLLFGSWLFILSMSHHHAWGPVPHFLGGYSRNPTCS